MKMSSFLALLIAALFLQSCSKQVEQARQLEISFGANTANTYPGGALLRMVNGSEVRDMELISPPYTVTLPNGTWNFHFVGFEGTTLWQGTMRCGSALSVQLSGENREVNLNMLKSSCLDPNSPFPEMSATKATWNQTLWGQARWRP
jgi:hypothetical protein